MAKITLKDGSIFEGTIEELVELLVKVDGLGAEFTEDDELKVGDYVVPLESADDEYEITNTKMKLGKVVEGDADIIRIEVVVHEDASEIGYTYLGESKHFRKATDEEVAKAKSEQKWAKIGRKPGEYEKGDIVRVIDASFSGHENGDLSEIIKHDEIKKLYEVKKMRDTVIGGWLGPDAIELVVPVESRVDIDD